MSRKVEEERRVLPFSPPHGRLRSRSQAAERGQGVVLLFTGIRYERIPDEVVSRGLAGRKGPTETDLRLG